MNCDDVRNAVYVFLDGEFAATEEEAFESHLTACSPCTELVQQEAAFLCRVKDGLKTPEAPAELRGRIQAALESTPPAAHSSVWETRRGRSWWRVLGWSAAPAAAGLATVLLLAYQAPEASSEHGVAARHAVAAHRTPLPAEIRGSADAVQSYVQNSVNFAASEPLPRRPGLELIGARLTQVNGEPAVIYQYRLGQERLSVLQTTVHPRRRHAPRTYRLGHVSGYGVVTFQTRGVTHAVVGSMPDDQLVRFVPATYTVP